MTSHPYTELRASVPTEIRRARIIHLWGDCSYRWTDSARRFSIGPRLVTNEPLEGHSEQALEPRLEHDVPSG